jgi:hypothetical protein
MQAQIVTAELPLGNRFQTCARALFVRNVAVIRSLLAAFGDGAASCSGGGPMFWTQSGDGQTSRFT